MIVIIVYIKKFSFEVLYYPDIYNNTLYLASENLFETPKITIRVYNTK